MPTETLIPKVALTPGTRGEWTLKPFTVSPADSEGTKLQAMMRGRGFVPPGTYMALHHARVGLVMSDTPDEMHDHQGIVRHAKGHVLLSGLGLGMVLSAILVKPEVTRVTVVEIDADLVVLVGEQFRDSRVKIVHANAFEYQPPKGVRYGAVWHDIWPTICSDNLEEMRKLTRKYARRADWQDCWGKLDCLRAERRGW